MKPLSMKEAVEEHFKASQSANYFAKKYCLIQHPVQGRIPFNLWPFQEDTVGEFFAHRLNIVLKSRQIGLSTLVSMIALWRMVFQKDQNIVVLATKQVTAMEIVEKVKLMYDNLPWFIKGKKKPLVYNKLELRLANNSRIKCFSASDNSGRSQAASLLIIDEAAFIANIDELYKSVQPTISTGGSCIMLSTPNGASGFFYNMWLKSETGENGFNPIKLPWQVVPTRTQEWRDQETATMGEKESAQEYDCDFMTTGATVVEAADLAKIEAKLVQPKAKLPVSERHVNKPDYWIYHFNRSGGNYAVVVDSARGHGKDESALVVVDIDRWQVVADYCGQLEPDELAQFSVEVATKYNKALIIAENTGIGHATCLALDKAQYPNLFKSVAGTSTTDFMAFLLKQNRPELMLTGFSTNSATRPLMISALLTCLRDAPELVQSPRIARQLRTFIWGSNNKEQAAPGCYDDLVMALAMACLLRSTAMEFRRRMDGLTTSALNGFTVVRYDATGQPIDPSNPYSGRSTTYGIGRQRPGTPGLPQTGEIPLPAQYSQPDPFNPYSQGGPRVIGDMAAEPAPERAEGELADGEEPPMPPQPYRPDNFNWLMSGWTFR